MFFLSLLGNDQLLKEIQLVIEIAEKGSFEGKTSKRSKR